MKSFLSQLKKTKIIVLVLVIVVLLQTVAIIHLFANRTNRNYEVNLVKINTEKDSLDYFSLKNSLTKADLAVRYINTILRSKNISNEKIAALNEDSLSQAVYLSKVSNRYSQFLVDLQYKLQHIPLGMPTNGYISSNFGMRKNPIPPKGDLIAMADEEHFSSDEALFTPKDSLGKWVQKKKKPEIPMQNHKGIDIAVAYGSDVRCAAQGTVIFAGQKAGYGTCVIVQHENGLSTLYAHLSEAVVQPNDVVSVNQVIAKSGNSGRSTGPHLHYEVRKDHTPINPKLFLNF